jgi:hypothetical protein
MTCCDHGYGRPSLRPRVSTPATYRSGTPRTQHPAVARWHTHLCGLATAIHEISGLKLSSISVKMQEWCQEIAGKAGKPGYFMKML